jgi:FKBP-type peptidyl-prolyl cis-trans isomerase FklB
MGSNSFLSRILKNTTMKKITFCLIALFLIASSTVVLAQKNKKNSKIDTTSLSYNLGLLFGNNLQMQGLTTETVNTNELSNGIIQALKGTASDKDMDRAQQIFTEKMQKIQTASKDEAAKAEKKWFDDNAKKNKNLKSTASGLQYEVMKMGDGAKPSPTSQVTTHYHGTLINGKVFDSSVERNSPATFPVNGVIKGWQEILVMMPVGSKWKVYIPSALAYGDKPVGSIPANSILIFEIELISIN